MTISQFVVLAGLAGFDLSKRQPRSETQKLWEGTRILNESITAIQTYQQYRDSREEDNGVKYVKLIGRGARGIDLFRFVS